MKTVNEVSKLTGVSIRTLHYYDTIGLLHPSGVTESGYRLYDDTALERLQQILLFRELEFPLKEIKTILDSKNLDRNKALEQQIELLTLKKEHLEDLIHFAREINTIGARSMDFTVFDTKKIDEYTKKAKEQWGKTEAYQEFEQKSKTMSDADRQAASQKLMELFVEFGALTGQEPSAGEVQNQVRKLQRYITEHFYNCTPEILSGLGKMYGGGGEFTENINHAGGAGTAEFVEKAIECYCKEK
ncbi:MAG: MerR family transcriptional regulator [Oscillospiraceae bacterium]|nr:MerR family transcriptional regulator [Oscillospiraceae bacterium]